MSENESSKHEILDNLLVAKWVEFLDKTKDAESAAILSAMSCYIKYLMIQSMHD